MKNHLTLKNIALVAILTSAALISFIIESLGPSMFVPGAKLGVSNVFTLLTLILSGSVEAIILVIIKSVLGCLITGNLGAVIYSLSAGLISVCTTAVLYRMTPKISIVAISVFGAVLHNTVQNAVYCLVTESIELFSVLPYLIMIGCVSGFCVGITVHLIIKKVPSSVFEKIINDKKTEERSESQER